MATIRGDWKDSGEQRDPAPSARTRAASEQQPDAQAAGGSKIEKERQRKERQRQRRMDEAKEALQVAIEAMLDARCVSPV